MMRVLKLIIKVLFILLLISCGEKNEAYELILEGIKAEGGLEKMKSIKWYYAEGSLGGMEYKYSVKFRDTVTVEVKGNGIYEKCTYTNGKSLVERLDTTFTYTGEKANNDYELQSWIFPFAYSDETVEQFIYKGEANSGKYHNVQVKFKNDETWLLYINDDTKITDRIETSSGLEITFNKYKEVNGLMMPVDVLYTLENGDKVTLQLDSVSIN